VQCVAFSRKYDGVFARVRGVRVMFCANARPPRLQIHRLRNIRSVRTKVQACFRAQWLLHLHTFQNVYVCVHWCCWRFRSRLHVFAFSTHAECWRWHGYIYSLSFSLCLTIVRRNVFFAESHARDMRELGFSGPVCRASAKSCSRNTVTQRGASSH